MFVLVSDAVLLSVAELYEAVVAANRTPDQTKRYLKVKKLLHQLPEHNFETFHYIAQHLHLVASHGANNKVTVSCCFGDLLRHWDFDMATVKADSLYIYLKK